jgi:hypothetical protein
MAIDIIAYAAKRFTGNTPSGLSGPEVVLSFPDIYAIKQHIQDSGPEPGNQSVHSWNAGYPIPF